mgnify:CR=1 FL=1
MPSVNENLVLTDEFPKTFEPMEVGKLKSTPEWDVLNEQINMYEAKASSQRANNYPTLAATASYNYFSLANEAEKLFDIFDKIFERFDFELDTLIKVLYRNGINGIILNPRVLNEIGDSCRNPHNFFDAADAMAAARGRLCRRSGLQIPGNVLARHSADCRQSDRQRPLQRGAESIG